MDELFFFEYFPKSEKVLRCMVFSNAATVHNSALRIIKFRKCRGTINMEE